MHQIAGLPQRPQGRLRDLAEASRVDDHDRARAGADQGRQLADRARADDHRVRALAADADPGEGHRGDPVSWAAISAAISSGARSSVLTVIQASFS